MWSVKRDPSRTSGEIRCAWNCLQREAFELHLRKGGFLSCSTPIAKSNAHTKTPASHFRMTFHLPSLLLSSRVRAPQICRAGDAGPQPLVVTDTWSYGRFDNNYQWSCMESSDGCGGFVSTFFQFLLAMLSKPPYSHYICFFSIVHNWQCVGW